MRLPVARSPARLPLLVLAIGASACAWVQMAEGEFKKPDVAYRSASLDGRLAERGGTGLNVVARVDNPNPVGLALADADYRLSIAGIRRAGRASRPRGWRSRRRNADVTLPASFKFADLGQAVATVLSKGSAGYKAEGSLGLKTPVGVVRVPLSHEGTFTLPAMPGIALGTPRVTSVAIHHATVELPVTLTAKGSLPVPLQALEAAVTIGGARIGEVSAKDLGTLEPGASRSVTLPLTVPFAGALDAAQAMLKGGSVPIALDGQLQSGPAPVPFQLKDGELPSLSARVGRENDDIPGRGDLEVPIEGRRRPAAPGLAITGATFVRDRSSGRPLVSCLRAPRGGTASFPGRSPR